LGGFFHSGLAFILTALYIVLMFVRIAHIVVATALMIILFSGCSANRHTVEKPEVRHSIEILQAEHPTFEWERWSFLKLDSSTFPDSVVFFLPVGSADFDIRTARVVEDVHGWAEDCEFRYIEYGHRQDANVIIVEDISASMGDYLGFTDNLIWGYLSILRDRHCEVSMVRFGKETIRILDWMLPSVAFDYNPKELPYPNHRGSDLSGALTAALDLALERKSSPNIIVVFSDGDFPVRDIPYNLIERANRYETSINILLHGYSPPGALAEMAEKTGGIYVVQPRGGFSPGMVSELLDRSYHVTYFPVHRKNDGFLHRVRFESSGGDVFTGEYRAPGKFEAPEEKPLAFILPEELSRTRFVPFYSPGNSQLSEETAVLLDSILSVVNSLPETIKLELQIKGFACNLGTTGKNFSLSKDRAITVRDYLRPKVNGNVSFDVSWFGEMYPLNSNSTDEERTANRRVEITVRCSSCS
jgi:outer membrane protein OmpA-like peptidoglycan-associated protein